MSKYLTTFSGRFGDLIWSLPTVKEISRQLDTPVDFMCMPAYESLLPLVEMQPYVDKAFISREWGAKFSGSPAGDQPWEAPIPDGYDPSNVRQLTYRYHPAMPLMSHTAQITAGINLPDSPLPFLSVTDCSYAKDRLRYVASAFNPDYPVQKQNFIDALRQHLLAQDIMIVDVGQMVWVEAAKVINSAKFFVGCRSANYVLAHGLAKRCLVYEPAACRRPQTYGCPYGEEYMPDPNDLEAFFRKADEWLEPEKAISA